MLLRPQNHLQYVKTAVCQTVGEVICAQPDCDASVALLSNAFDFLAIRSSSLRFRDMVRFWQG